MKEAAPHIGFEESTFLWAKQEEDIFIIVSTL